MAAKTPPRQTFKVGQPRRHRLAVPPPLPANVVPDRLTPQMVDRLFWRAGFGPSAADRANFTGKLTTEAVDWLLNTPQGDLVGPAPTREGVALDPTTEDTDLVLQWVDRMIRTSNPLVERMTFFWHRLWANSRMEVDPPQLLIQQNALFREYSDFGRNPDANFSQLAQAVTINPAMLRYLSGESNVRGGPNENYARELMELFTLGVISAGGQPNYTEEDVKQLAKALSGWVIDDTDPNNASSRFDSSRWYSGPKRILGGNLSNYRTEDAVAKVLEHVAHPDYIVKRLWAEFIVGAPDAATLADLVKTYTTSGRKIKPVLRKILLHPQLYASPDEPTMIKAPIVYVVGCYRTLGLYVTDRTAVDALDSMGQTPYFPPTVAGWEYGAAWLNTNTALARFAFVGRLIATPALKPVDQLGERPEEAFAKAHAAVGSPWLSAATKTALLDYATRASSSSRDARLKRQQVLRALLLAGPDAQVM